MRKLLAAICLGAFALTANAQLIKPKSQDSYTVDANGNIVKKQTAKRGLFDKDKTPIDAKYLAGACPERDKKVVWETSIVAENQSAKEIYDKMLNFLQAFCKGPKQTELSNVSVVDETQHVIGARMQEWLVFESKPLSLDQTKFSYQLVVRIVDGRANVMMRNMNYTYEEERGGGTFPAEDMLLDENCLNKKGDGFHKGGFKKFRMKTIDRKDEIFAQLEAALK